MNLFNLKEKPYRLAKYSLIVGLVSFFCIFFIQHYASLFITLFIFFSCFLAPILAYLVFLKSRYGTVFLSFVFKSIVSLFTCVIIYYSFSELLKANLPYIYSPPALTHKNLPVYQECIAFAKKNYDDKTFVLSRGKRVSFKGSFYMLSKENSYERDKAEEFLSPEIIKELENLSRGLYEVDCVAFKREENALLFFKMGRGPFPDLLPSLKTILPYGPGVLYSLDGNNPNDTSNDFLKDYKPFEKIFDNWYTSRSLTLGGPRLDRPIMLPSALIDHSLKVDSLEFSKDDNTDKSLLHKIN